MGKKIVIGVLAVLAWIAASQITADAATCLSWKTIGGSSMCVAWATKGVQVAITFKDGCYITSEGEGGTFAAEACQAAASATSTDTPTSIAFCGPNQVRVACDQPFSFGPVIVGGQNSAVDCLERSDNESPQGEANERHRCVARAALPPHPENITNCNTCCTTAGFGPTCSDLTPVEMHTRVDAIYPLSSGGEVPPPS